MGVGGCLYNLYNLYNLKLGVTCTCVYEYSPPISSWLFALQVIQVIQIPPNVGPMRVTNVLPIVGKVIQGYTNALFRPFYHVYPL